MTLVHVLKQLFRGGGHKVLGAYSTIVMAEEEADRHAGMDLAFKPIKGVGIYRHRHEAAHGLTHMATTFGDSYVIHTMEMK